MSVVTIDEGLMAYQPCQDTKEYNELIGEPIPVVFIPRKPHANGLLLYIVCSFILNPVTQSKMPVILDMHPHLTSGDVNPATEIVSLMGSWKYQTKPHIFADAAFGSFSVVEMAKQSGFKVTTSVPISHESWLWNLLGTNVPPEYWRAAISPTGVVASCHVIAKPNGNLVYQHLLTNAYDVSTESWDLQISGTPDSTNARTNAPLPATGNIPYFKKTTLKTMPMKKLKVITKRFNIKSGMTILMTFSHIR